VRVREWRMRNCASLPTASACMLTQPHVMSRAGASSTNSSEAYATIVAGDGSHACQAAVLGHALRQLDPHRPRLALVHNVSDATRHVLQANNLWHVVQMAQPTLSPQTYLRVPYVWQNKSRTWGFGRIPALQLELWSLPHERVLYFDCDHLPILGTATRLHSLWRTPRDVILAAAPEAGRGCFNSGMMLLQPRGVKYADLHLLWKRLARAESHPRLFELRRRCPTGWNLDQPILNLAFEQTWSWSTTWRSWRMLTPFWFDAGRRDQLCDGPTLSDRALSKLGESFHFYAPFRPWEKRGSKRMADCLARGQQKCDLRNATHQQAAATSVRTASGAKCTGVLAAAVAVWWSHLRKLPSATRQTCAARIARAHHK
jgi:hypothetical protein